MSSILEALRKLEEEKSARRGGIGNIAGKVAANTRRNRERPAWVVAAAMVAVAVAAISGTYAVMRAPSTPVATIAKPATSMPQPAASLPQAAVQDTGPAAPPLEASPPSQAKTSPQKPSADGKRPIIVAASKSTSAAAGNTAASEPSAGLQLPSFKVTGIAWQQESGSRVAVVNGTPVTEETIIEGARIEEILPDSVRFSLKGKEFRVYVEKDPA